MMFVNRRAIRIEWGDCDPAGIVFFPRYFAYFDACTMSLFEAAGLPKQQMMKDYDFAGFPMVDTRARFLLPSRFGDDVEVESCITAWRRSSFDVRHRLYRPDGLEMPGLAVEGFEARVWTGHDPDKPGGLRSRETPADIVRRFLSDDERAAALAKS
jgi:4-hydroxybenzoyl-CoA thioesterase